MRKMTVGDWAPNFLLHDFSGKPHELYATDIVGGPIVVIFAGAHDDAAMVLKQFADQAQTFDAMGAHCYILLDHALDFPGNSAFMALQSTARS